LATLLLPVCLPVSLGDVVWCCGRGLRGVFVARVLLFCWGKHLCVEGEQGAHIYSLRKVLGGNMRYIAYGTWESMRDYEEHFK
jgi:hypothetical protein